MGSDSLGLSSTLAVSNASDWAGLVVVRLTIYICRHALRNALRFVANSDGIIPAERRLP